MSFVQYIPVTAPEMDLSRSIDDVRVAVDKFAPNLVGACDDSALLVLSYISNPSAVGLAPVGETATFAFDKWEQILAARESGFATMQTQRVTNTADVVQFPFRPALLKPRFALDIGEHGVSKGKSFLMVDEVISPEASSAIFERPYLIQEFKKGVGEGFFGIADGGEIYAPFGHRRLRMMNPMGSGASACISRKPETAEMTAARTLIQHAAWTGPFMIEQLRDDAGAAWFMEFNGRFWGSVALARRCGLDIPRLAFEIASKIEPQIPSDLRKGFARHLGRDLIYLLFVLRGPRQKPPPPGWPNRLNSLMEVLSPCRLTSFYNYDEFRAYFFS